LFKHQTYNHLQQALTAILLQADEQAKSNLRMFLLDLLEAKIPNLEKAILSKSELSSIFTQEQLAHYSSRVKTKLAWST
jgi:hypothetical protein